MEKRIIRLRPNEKPESLVVETDKAFEITVVSNAPDVDIIEVGDTHFRLNSAVFMPNTIENVEATETVLSPGITLLERTFRFLQLSKRKLLLAGHTDTVGSDDSNVKLSELRADCVKAVLLGDRDLFAEVANAPHIPDKAKKESTLRDDKLQIADWVAAEFNLPCSRKENQGDPIRTFKAFQKAYNDFGFPGAEPIPVDGDWGPLTWKAAFDFYQHRLADRLLLNVDGLKALRGKLGLDAKLLGGDKKRVGCGEFQPIENPNQDNMLSRTNRRVELLFFQPDAPVDAPCLSGPCAKKNCPLFKPLAETRGKVAVARWTEPLTIAGHSETRELEVLFPGIAAGTPVEFSIFRVSDQNAEPERIASAEDVVVESGKAKAAFNELHEDVLRSLPERDVLRYSYFFVAKGVNFEINSARLHAELDNVIFP
ncbi:MAG: hypothetical protein ACOY0T_41040 [Myxococcota bacterium]